MLTDFRSYLETISTATFVETGLVESTFKQEERMEKEDFADWVREIGGEVSLETKSKLILIYSNDKKPKHLGTYDSKTNMLMTDDMSFFGM